MFPALEECKCVRVRFGVVQDRDLVKIRVQVMIMIKYDTKVRKSLGVCEQWDQVLRIHICKG